MKLEVSNGEIVDKFTILQIKKEKITNPIALANVAKEWEMLVPIVVDIVDEYDNGSHHHAKLLRINTELWEIEDKLRVLEDEYLFKDEFIQLARRVYKVNDTRAQVKKEINLMTNSKLVEEKFYTTNIPEI